jgi:hypothetical protein
MRRVRQVDGGGADDGRQAEFQLLDVHRVGLQFGDEDIYALGKFCGVGIWAAVTGPYKREAVPVEAIATIAK